MSYNIWQPLKLQATHAVFNLGLTGPDGVQVTIISCNIYKIQKLPALKELKEVELILVTLDLMAYKPLSSVTIFIKLKNY